MWYHDCFDEINMTFSKRRRSISKLAKYDNMRAWQMWYRILIQRALNRYKFEGLPETINERVLKLSLLWHASVCIFEERGHLMGLPGAAGTSGVTVYGDYTHSIVYGRDGWTKDVTLWVPGGKEDPFLQTAYIPEAAKARPTGVWFRENPMKSPFADICIEFADNLADTWRKMENARLLMVKPMVIIGDKEDAPTARYLFEEMSGNSPLIFLTRRMDSAPMDVERLETSPNTLKEYTDHIEVLLAKFDQLCGVDANSNVDKKERLITSEIDISATSTSLNIRSICDYMQQYGLDLVNEHWGTNIRVVPYREEVEQDALAGLDQGRDEPPVGGDRPGEPADN